MGSLDNRLKLLEMSGQVSSESISIANKVIEYFANKLNIELTEENGSMLITHITMANERILNNEPVEELSELIVTQIKQENQYGEAQEITSQLIEFFDSFIEVERNYIEMHVLNIIKENI